MREVRLIVLAALVATTLLGCSVYRASHQPSQKNTSVMNSGAQRDLVIAEFGPPISSEPFEGGKKDIYTFIQGYSKGNKTGRALFHGAADVLTIGLWEVIGTPIESNYDGKKMTVRVVYDAQDRVKTGEVLSVTDP